MKHRLEAKISAIFSIIIMLIIGSYFLVFRAIYFKHEYRVMSEESMHTLRAMKQSVDSVVDTANNYSKILLSDQSIQEMFKTGDIYSHISNQTVLSHKIYNLIQFQDNIEMVYFVDQKQQVFKVGENAKLKKKTAEFEDISWYDTLLAGNGEYLLVVGEEDIAQTKMKDQICLLRLYKDLENFSCLGILGVGINLSAIQNTYQDILENESNQQIVFLDNQNQVICQDGEVLVADDSLMSLVDQLETSKDDELIMNMEIGKKTYLVTGITFKQQNWKILRILPLDINHDSMKIMLMNVSLVIFSALLILLGTILVSRMMTIPIEHVLYSMKQAEGGQFVKIREKSLLNEFRYLYEGYNHMIERIQELIEQTVEEQKTIRRIEFNEIQEQMKPHFLYNTLDAIEALALMEEKEKVCEIIQALGNFYRKSVSKGRDMLTIDEEIVIVRDYIKIMKIRFEDLFIEEFLVDDSCKYYLIPKLTLQPIVENAIHHGLRGKEEKGHLWIEVKIEDNWLLLRVADDGCGISQEKLNELMMPTTEYKGKSVGLRGTLERLNIIYGEHFKYRISSTEDGITSINLYIHIESLEV